MWAGSLRSDFSPQVCAPYLKVMTLGGILKQKFDKRTFIRWKVYIDRSKMYIGYIQFLLIIFMFIKSFGENQFTEIVFSVPYLSFPIIFVLFVLCSLVLGYMDSKLGFREEEIRNHSKSNPVLTEISMSLTKLHAKVEEIEKRKNSRQS